MHNDSVCCTQFSFKLKFMPVCGQMHLLGLLGLQMHWATKTHTGVTNTGHARERAQPCACVREIIRDGCCMPNEMLPIQNYKVMNVVKEETASLVVRLCWTKREGSKEPE